MSSMSFVPLARRICATGGTVTVEDVRGGRRELHQIDTVRSTAGGLIVGPPSEGRLRWVMRSWRGTAKRNGFAAMRQEFSKKRSDKYANEDEL